MSTTHQVIPAVFRLVLESLRDAQIRPEVTLEEVPPPVQIAPFAVAVRASASALGEEDEPEVEGRFLVLFDPEGQVSWDGQLRIVTLARSSVDPDMGADPLLPQVAWSWLTESLTTAGVMPRVEAGTVTRVLSESFAGLESKPDEVDVEIRASWSPESGDVSAHLLAWSQFLCTVAGIEPHPAGVRVLRQARHGS